MSEANEGSEAKRPGSSWHAWVAQPGAAASAPAPVSEPVEGAPLASAEMVGVGDNRVGVAPPDPSIGTLPVLPSILGRIERVEAAVERLAAGVDALASVAEQSTATVTDGLADHLESVARLTSAQMVHIDQHGAGLTERLDALDAAVAAQLEAQRAVGTQLLDDHAAALTAQLDEQGAALRDQMGGEAAALVARVETLSVSFAGPLGELGAIVAARLSDLSRTVAERVDTVAARVDAMASAPAPSVDLAPFEELRRSLDAVAAQVDAFASAPAPASPVDLAPLERLRHSVDALADDVRAAALAPLPPAPPAAPAEDTARLLTAASELAAQVASLQDELTQLKRRVGVRAKMPIVIDEGQMDDIARRVAALVAAQLERTFEIAE